VIVVNQKIHPDPIDLDLREIWSLVEGLYNAIGSYSEMSDAHNQKLNLLELYQHKPNGTVYRDKVSELIEQVEASKFELEVTEARLKTDFRELESRRSN
jgi:hypothetical protein